MLLLSSLSIVKHDQEQEVHWMFRNQILKIRLEISLNLTKQTASCFKQKKPLSLLCCIKSYQSGRVRGLRPGLYFIHD